MAALGPYGRRNMIIRNGNIQTGIVVESLAELKERGAPLLGLQALYCRVQLEDETDVIDEEFFSRLEQLTVFILSMLLYELLYLLVTIST